MLNNSPSWGKVHLHLCAWGCYAFLHTQLASPGISMLATHGPASARVLGLCSTFRSTQGKLDLGHM